MNKQLSPAVLAIAIKLEARYKATKEQMRQLNVTVPDKDIMLSVLKHVHDREKVEK